MRERSAGGVGDLTRTTFGGLFLLFAGFCWLIPMVFLCRFPFCASTGGIFLPFALTLLMVTLSACAHLFRELSHSDSGGDEEASRLLFRRNHGLLSLPAACLAIFAPVLFGWSALFWTPLLIAAEAGCLFYLPPFSDRLIRIWEKSDFFTPSESLHEHERASSPSEPLGTLSAVSLSEAAGWSDSAESSDSAPVSTLRFIAATDESALDENAAGDDFAGDESAGDESEEPLFSAGFLPGLFADPESFDAEEDWTEEEEEEAADEASPDQTGVWMRFDAGPGRERIEGWVRVRFDPSEEVCAAHLSFCPPFGERPELEIAQISGPEVRISVTDVEPFGARIEVKRWLSERWEPADDDSVRLAFFAAVPSD